MVHVFVLFYGTHASFIEVRGAITGAPAPSCLHVQARPIPSMVPSIMIRYSREVQIYAVYRCGRTIGHLTVGNFAVTGVPLFLVAFLVTS